jgi:hypothetical protein
MTCSHTVDFQKLAGLKPECPVVWLQTHSEFYPKFASEFSKITLFLRINSKNHDQSFSGTIIAQYQPLELRQDVGALWENWLISERKKALHSASPGLPKSIATRRNPAALGSFFDPAQRW